MRSFQFFSHSLDLIVITHIHSTKLQLYASLDSKLSTHRAVLSKREDALKDAREALVRDGANVVSGKADGLLMTMAPPALVVQEETG